MTAPAVALRHITRRFGPVVANDDVSLEIAPGRIHALVGENGAGKTTLMRVLYGLLAPDAGTIEIDGRPVRIRHPSDAMRLGLGMVHQHFMLVGPLSVAENVCLGHEPHGPLGALDRARAEREVEERARRYGLPVPPRARVDALSVGAQQRVEILKALVHGARVLILDEPTAVLTPQEVDDLFRVLRDLRAEGSSVVLITHKLSEVKAIADHVTVMRAGRVAGDAEASAWTLEQIAELMVGRAMSALEPPEATTPGAPRLQVRDLDVRDDRGLEAVRSVSFDIGAGEIVGFAGVEGNGQHELIEAIAGLRPHARGQIVVNGRRCSGHSAREHTRAGLAHIPADRLHRGLVPSMTVAENLLLGRQHDEDVQRVLSPRTLSARTRPRLEEFDVRPANPEARAEQLSGGNQQKLVVAREVTRGAGVVLAAHPTRGVDLGAVEFIHRRLLAERARGAAVLVLSSELNEILALSDRILVLYEGRVVHATRPSETDERALGLAMAGKDVSKAGR